MTIRHLFWDFDGTLYDSYPNVCDALRLTLEDLRHPELYNAAAALRLVKTSVYNAATTLAVQGQFDVHTLLRVFEHHHAAEPAFPPYAGLADCLQTLHAHGVRHYLYTHRDERAIEQLKQDGLWHLFTDAVIRTDGFPDKPAPDALLALMARNGVNAAEAAMVGDRDIDIGAGHNAGMQGILFDPDGFYPTLDVEMRVNTMAQLCENVLKG